MVAPFGGAWCGRACELIHAWKWPLELVHPFLFLLVRLTNTKLWCYICTRERSENQTSKCSRRRERGVGKGETVECTCTDRSNHVPTYVGGDTCSGRVKKKKHPPGPRLSLFLSLTLPFSLPAARIQGFVAYKEFLQDVDVPLEVETQAYIDNFVFGRDQVNMHVPTYLASPLTGTRIDLGGALLVGLCRVLYVTPNRRSGEWVHKPAHLR